MKVVGLLGGMSWESTIPYYRVLNETVKKRLGGLHSAKVVLYSVDFHEIEALQRLEGWDTAGATLAVGAAALERAGADFVVLCTNTMHKVAPAIERALTVPLLHIADATATAVKGAGLRTVGLLGTRFTMEQEFYVGRLRDLHGLEVLVPDAEDRAEVHRVIYEELCLGCVLAGSRIAFEGVIDRLAARGAQGVILGCTEIAMLVDPACLAVPAFDTALLHARAAADFALADADAG
jgi:aspartate racemase